MFDDTELAHFVKSSSHQSGFRIVSAAESIGDATGDSDDIFHRSTKTHPVEIAVGIDAQSGRRKEVLDQSHDRGLISAANDRGRRIHNHLLRVTRAA